MTKSLPLLASNSDAKTSKGFALKFLTDILYLAPANEGGFGNLCVNASAGCLAVCLFTAGRGRMSNVRLGRIRKTRLFFTDKKAFFMQLNKDIVRGMKRAAKLGMTYCVRLNGTSDIRWENIKLPLINAPTIFDLHNDVQFYDYTKLANRKNVPANYDLTFSYSGVEAYQPFVAKAVANGERIAVVFRNRAIVNAMLANGETFLGLPVVDGDDTDIRHLDPRGAIVALYAKGKAKQDVSGFVVG